MKRTEYARVRPFKCGVTHNDMPIHRTRKTGRNEKCPCGSGEKFKKCCLN